MPWIAFVPDMSGVCSVLGTFEMTWKPTKAARMRIAISVSRSIGSGLLGGLLGGGFDRLARRLVHDLAAPRDAGSGDDLVVEVEAQRAVVVHEQFQQRLDVARVERR